MSNQVLQVLQVLQAAKPAVTAVLDHAQRFVHFFLWDFLTRFVLADVFLQAAGVQGGAGLTLLIIAMIMLRRSTTTMMVKT